MMSSADHKNILAIKAHSERTREIVRDLETKINTIDMLESQIQQLTLQIQNLQVKMYTGAATDGS